MKRLSLTLWLLTCLCAFGAARPHGWLGGSTIFQRDTFTESPPASISYPVAFAYGFNLGPVGLTPNVVLEGNLYKSAPTAPNITMTGGGGLAWSRTYYPPVAGSEAALLATGIWAPTTGCSIVVDSLPIRRTAVYFWAVAGDTSAPLTVSINGSCVVSNWVPSVVPGWRKFGPYECTPAPSGQITIASLPAQPCLCALGLWQEVPNQLPIVAITTPAGGSSFVAPATVACGGNAVDLDGTVTSVYLVLDGVATNACILTGTNWVSGLTNLVSGTYHVTVTAIDDRSGRGTVGPVTFTVTTPPNLPPVVTLTAPLDGDIYTTAPLTNPPPMVAIPLSATASDPDGTVDSVVWYAGTEPILTKTTPPYSGTWNALAGRYAVTAKATDDVGATTTTPIAWVTVTNSVLPPTNNLPVITLTSPEPGAGYTAPASITVTATATDSDGTISWVKFYRDGAIKATDASSPYTWTDTAVPAGTYNYYATTMDNSNAVVQSTSVDIVVQSPPPPAPAVNAGPDVSVQLPATATLAGVSLNTTSNLWTVISSNGVVVLTDATLTNTVVQFVTAGNYTLRLTGYGATATASDDVNLTVLAVAPPVNNIILPVVVDSRVQANATRSFNVAGVNPASTYYLLLRGDNMQPPGKVSVAVNGSAYVPLDNNLTVLGNAALFHGINGCYDTMWVRIPLAPGTLVTGQNTILFRHNGVIHTDAEFIEIKVQDALGVDLLTDADFSQQDRIWGPDYAPTLTNDTAVAAGQAIWETRPWNGTGLACQQCHSASVAGTWAFPSVSIRSSAQATFSDTESEQIVAWIWWKKTHDTNCYPFNPPNGPDGKPQYAGPWNPPYQPGPGLDSLPARQWATGAGLNWVLSDDTDTLAYLFPSGISYARATNVTLLNVREIPIAAPLPSIRRWIPSQSMSQAWGAVWDASNVATCYAGVGWNNIRNVLASTKAGGYTAAGMSNAKNSIQYWANDWWAFVNPRRAGPAAPAVYDLAYGRRITDTANWALLRMMEMMRENEIEGHQFKSTSREARVWADHIAFDTGPNILTQPHTLTGINESSELVFQYFTFAWYHVQLVLNPGNYSDGSEQSDNRPMDWPYTYYFVPTLHDLGGQHVPVLYTLTMLKALHDHDNTNGLACQGTTRGGWLPGNACEVPRLMNWEVRRMFDGSTLTALQKADLLDVMLRYYVTKTLQFTPAQYYACGYESLPPASYTSPDYGRYGVVLPDQLWWAIPEFRTRGVPEATLNNLKTWATSMWPNIPWAGR